MATCNRLPIQRAEIEIPYRRIWTARLTFTDREGPATGEPAEIMLGDLRLVGTVIEAGSFGGVATARVVAGRGGWRRTPEPLSFQNDANLNSLDIAQALASSVGETVVGTGVTLGAHWSFDTTVSAACNMDRLGAWYVREDGVTVLGLREDGAEVKSVVEDFDPARERATIPVEETALVSYLPGAIVVSESLADALPIRHVRILLTADRIYVEASSREQAVDRLAEHVTKRLRFLGTYTYRIIEQIGERLQLQSVDTIDGLPDQLLVDKAHGIPGVLSDCTESGEVLIAFADGNAGRPRVVGFLGGATTVYMSSRVEDQNVMLAPTLVTLLKLGGKVLTATAAALRALDPTFCTPEELAEMTAAAVAFAINDGRSTYTAQLKASPAGAVPTPEEIAEYLAP